MKHTAEPWSLTDDGTFVEVMAGEKTVLPAIRKTEAAEDFRRVVACVNACAGISDEALDSWMNPPEGGFGHPHGPWPAHIISLQRAAETLRNQRDELLAAIETTLDENGHLADGDNCTLIALKRALEKVGAGTTAIEWHNDRVEGRDAASSRRVPSHDGLGGNGSEVGAGDTAMKGKQ